MLEDLKTILTIRTGKEYTTEQLETMIEYAKTIINSPITEVTTHTEHAAIHGGAVNTYLTDYYPVLDVCSITVDDEPVTIKHVNNENGVITLQDDIQGELCIQYRIGLPTETLNSYLLPIVTQLVIDSESNGRIGSITEGDMSISYDNSNNMSMQLDQLINNLRGLYGAKVRLL